ncbi:MAG: ABC transporter ATP-binding protein [Bacteroidota bacterium]|nr:ABC transporter ATP-binding protein [Bacteroidota bacterium]
MNDIVIKAENLGKKYMIFHESPERYSTLRDVIHQKTKSLFSKKKQTAREEFWALKDINFEVKRGEAVGIIGRNGAGKSTLLKILSRITEPAEGYVEMNGRVSSLLEVGTGFHPELTGRENIFLNGAILGMSRAEIKKKFDDIVDFSGVEKFLDTPVKRYSSGMYLRLAFAVAAHLEPEILIVDEVLAVGDAEFQKKCLGKMDEVSKKEGRTVLFVSHNLGAVQNLCSRGLLLQDGALSFSGDMDKTISRYVSVFLVEQTARAWKKENAPGNEYARLLQAKVSDARTGDTHTFNAMNGFVLELEIENLISEKTQLDITYHLLDEKGILITVSSSAFSPETNYYSGGTMKIRTNFPGNILNEGTYTFSRLLFVMNKEIVLTEWNDVLSFKVVKAAATIMEGMWGKEGVVKINNLNWEIHSANAH